MTAVPVKEEHAALVSQCLDFCQTLATNSLNFSFTLTLGNTFTFSLDTNGKESLAPKAKEKKKKTTLRRDARRKAQFLKKKLEVSDVDILSQSDHVSEEEEAGKRVEMAVDENVFKCDQCQNTFKTENGLKIHVGKAHKKVNQVQATPDQLRQRPEGPMDTSIIPSWISARRSLPQQC